MKAKTKTRRELSGKERSKKTRWLSFLLSIVMMISLVPFGELSIKASAANLSESQFSAKISELKNIFRHGEYWNRYNSCGNEGTGYNKCPYCSSSCSASCSCKCGQFIYNGAKIAAQCHGFALKMAYLCFGDNANSWPSVYDVNSICAGDIVRLTYGHTIFIVKVSGDDITYADCNYVGPCKVRWNGKTTKSQIASKLKYIGHKPGNTLKGTDSSSNNNTNVSIKGANRTSDLGVEFIKSFEGFRSKAYKAVSSERYLTIGYGHYGSDVYSGMTISESQAVQLLKSDLKRFENSLNSFLEKYGRKLSQNEYDAIVSFSFNVGTGWMSDSSYSINKYLRTGQYTEAQLRETLEAWSNAGGRRLEGLVRRRRAEADMFFEGKYLNGVISKDQSGGNVSSSTYAIYRVNARSGLNVRKGPGTGYGINTAYTNGTQISIDQVSGNWGHCSAGWVCLDYCVFVSGGEPIINKPAAPSLNLSTPADHATGSRITVTWPAAADADCYDVYLKNSAGAICQEVRGTTSHSADFMVSDNNAGTYTVTAYSRNSKYTSDVSNTVTVRAYAPSKVTFVDYNGNVLSEQSVKYGENAVVPSTPSRYGFTFSGWSGSYTNVKSNQTVTAQYTRNKYTVKFFNEDGKLIDTQKVYYEYAATAPSYEPNSGYDFVSWDKSFNYITEDTNVTAVVKWYNEDMSVIVSDMDAVREKDGTGVTVTYSISNQKNEITSARAIITLKTSEGKLVTTTESSAFSIKNNVTKSQEVFVPTTDGAYKAEVYIVANYKTAVPVSESVSKVINQQGENWTSWSTSVPPEGSLDVQSRTEYRFRDKKFTTSSASSMSGWNYYKTTFVWSDYGPWSSWTDSSISETDYRDVDTRKVYLKTQYNYYHYSLKKKNGSTTTAYCGMAGYNSSTAGMGISPAVSEVYHTTGWIDYQLTYLCQDNWNDGWKNAYSGISCCKSGISGPDHWYYLGSREVTKKQYRYRDRSKIYTYHFWKWGDWSDWTSASVSANDNRAVETRTTYRYKTNEIIGTEDNTGVVRTISGKVSENYAGKDALLIIYKVDEASDYSNQYVEQIKIGEDGTYSATFKLLTEPTVKSGDYTVTLGIAGTNEAIYIDTIEAPKPEYTVTFYDDTENGKVLDTQTVLKGENAVFPEVPEKEGYHFVYWDSTGTNVTDNLDIYAHYEINQYTVVFVNWSQETVTVQTYEHGQTIAPPEIIDTDDSKAVGWEGMVEGPVTQNMIITAKYSTKTFNVRFIDWDDNLISSQTVEYGHSAEVPDALKKDDYVFFNWSSDNSYTYVTEDAVVVPLYVFEETVETPIVDIENGDYDTAQTVTITCPTEKSVIYYTIDGSDPNEEGAIEYTGPITIDRTCELRVVATAFHMNNSYEETRYIAINTDHMTSEWVSFNEIPDYVMNNLQSYDVQMEIGYKFKDLTTSADVDFSADLEENGWTFESSEYGEWSNWIVDNLDDEINGNPRENGTIDKLIDPEVEEKEPDPEDVVKYQYSRWKYTEDGETKYSRLEIEGTDGEWEYIRLDNSLPVSSFDGQAPGYSYQGETWYNRTNVTVQEVPNHKLYRYRGKTATYSKWTSWTTEAPSENEIREYESSEVYQYTAPKKYVVNLNTSNGGITENTEFLFNAADQKLERSISDFQIEGYNFDGAFKDSEYTEAWDFENDIVQTSTTLYLKWTPKQYTVTFVGFDDEVVDTQKVTFLEYAEIPIFEEVDGYVFCGLDTDSMLVTGDMTVKAKYVKEEEYVKLSLNKTSYALYTGSSVDLVATVTPESAENRDVIWRSSDDNIAYVDDMGKVTAINEGTVTIYATCCETGYTESCEITVSKNVDDSIVISPKAKISVDDANQLRGIKVDANTVIEVKELFVNDNLRFFDANGEEMKDESLVGTGTVIKLMSGYTTLDTLTVVLTGDMNCDGKVNNRDVAMGTRYLVEKEAFGLAQVTAFDVNGDGKVNNRDAAMLSRYLVGKETL